MAHKRKASARPQPVPAPVAQAEALERFAPLLPTEDLAALLAELQRPLRQALRVNPLKVDDPDRAVADWSARYGWKLSRVPYCPTGWWVDSSKTLPSQTVEHRTGQFYIQDAASMLPVELFDFDPQSQPLVLDLAASPGGKTTHLTARTLDNGLVIANDSSLERITPLRLVLQTWGAANTAVTHYPGERFGAWFPNTFDAVLLDAPCSMQGLRSTEAHPMRAITPREVNSLAERQLNLLESALRAVRPGGQVVYSTCTLTPAEDELVLEALLERHPQAVQVDDANLRLPRPAPGLTQVDGQMLHPSLAGALRFWPHSYTTAGFFAARLTKLTELPPSDQTPPARPLDKTGLAYMERRNVQRLSAELEAAYSFDLSTVLERLELVLYERGPQIYALPQRFLRQFSGLPFQSLGLLLGEQNPDGFYLSHEWVCRFASQMPGGRYRLPAEMIPAWLRGEDIHGEETTQTSPRMALVVDSEGRLLGRAKMQRSRIKNLLPKRLVIQG